MKEVEIFQSLNLALISNAIYTLAVYFLLWVSLRAARLTREGEERGGILPKILVSLFGLGVIYNGLLLSAFLRLNLSSAAKNLEGIKAAGEKLSPAAETFLSVPMVSSAGEVKFSLMPGPIMAVWWAVVVIMLLGILWMPQKKKS